jgi:hypothetical protein
MRLRGFCIVTNNGRGCSTHRPCLTLQCYSIAPFSSRTSRGPVHFCKKNSSESDRTQQDSAWEAPILKLRMVLVPEGAGGEWLGCRSTPLLFRQTDRKRSRAKSLLAGLSGKAHPVRSCLRARAPSGRRWRAAAPCRSKVLRAFPSQIRNSVPRRSRRPDRLLGTGRNRCT